MCQYDNIQYCRQDQTQGDASKFDLALDLLNNARPVAHSMEINGSAEGGVASNTSPYGGILITRGSDKFKYKSFASGGIGIGWVGVSGQVISTTYFYVGDISNFNFDVFDGKSIDLESSLGADALVIGVGVTYIPNTDVPGEYMIGVSKYVGVGTPGPSGSLSWNWKEYY